VVDQAEGGHVESSGSGDRARAGHAEPLASDTKEGFVQPDVRIVACPFSRR
jgi:hypothetical protein